MGTRPWLKLLSGLHQQIPIKKRNNIDILSYPVLLEQHSPEPHLLVNDTILINTLLSYFGVGIRPLTSLFDLGLHLLGKGRGRNDELFMDYLTPKGTNLSSILIISIPHSQGMNQKSIILSSSPVALFVMRVFYPLPALLM